MTVASAYDPASAAAPARAARRPPVERIRVLRWIHQNLFDGPLNTMLTIGAALVLVAVVPSLVRWALVDAVWSASGPEECLASTGACWAVIVEKHRFMFFGQYPYDEQWRPTLAILVYLAATGLSFWRACWSPRIMAPLWIATIALFVVLIFGGFGGLSFVETDKLGGIPLTFIVFTWTIATGLPLGIVLALGRRSRLPLIRSVCVVAIEAIRGVPLVTILFSAAVVFPLFLPAGWSVDKLGRVLVAMSVFAGCYFSEIVRGGLQAIPKGQYEAAQSLGLSYWPTTLKIVLPQALRIVIPGLMNQIISIFKNSTYVIVIGLFDLLNTTSIALSDPLWIRFYREGYLFVALAYFSGAYGLSRFSQHLERTLSAGRRY